MSVLGVDIGGTKIAAGRVPDDFEIAAAEIAGLCAADTHAAEGFDRSIGQLWSAIEQTLDRSVTAIGIAAPGPLDPWSGLILNPPNLPGWRNIPLAQMTQEKFGLPVRLENDCNAAALGEARFGAGRGHRHVFYAAIGTGIGSGIVIDGEIFRGAHQFAGEGGHLTIDYRSEVVCGCGSRGCIEALASGSAIARGEGGDFVIRIGAWLGGIVSLLDPSIIVLGGGVMLGDNRDAWFEQLREIVPRRTLNPSARLIPIVPAHFGAQSGIVGAAALFA